jgi:hypothetical protein
VPGGRPGIEVEDAVADDLDRLLGYGGELAPEDVEVVSVEPAGAALEPAWVNEVRRSDLAHVHAKVRVAASEHACGTRVVEVDVRQHEMTKIAEREAPALEPGDERAQARRRTAVDEGGLVAGEQVRRDDPRPPEVEEIEELEAVT